MVDLSRLLLAAGLAVILYVAAGLLLVRLAVRWAWRRFGAQVAPAAEPAPGRRRRALRLLRAGVLALAALGLLCAAYARLVEPWWPEVTRVEIRTPKLAAGSRPVRLVLIADTHSDPQPRLEPRLPELVAGLQPDLIVFAGDAVNCREGLPHFRECLTRLAAIAPVYAVRGNWEQWWFPQADLYGGTGVKVLDGRAAKFAAAGGGEIWLAGASVDHEKAIPAALAAIPKGGFAILVHHYPEAAAAGVGRGADLALAADTHGGQVRLPLVGPLVRLSRYGSYFDAGLHRRAGGWLYVSRGLGMEGGGAPRVRFLCRPEITLFEIAAENGD